jgi:endonuclease I
MKRLITLIFVLILQSWLIAQIPSGYYNQANGLNGEALQQALHNIIDNHTAVSYNTLWNYFQQTDKKSNGKVWDMYSDVPGGTSPYEYTFLTDQCGNYSGEGDCYNREHSFPKSWFGGEIAPMYTDMFHLYPTDGYVNGKRDNYPYGEVGTASWTSQNGSKLGSCVAPGYSGTVFEPIDSYKGDLARTYFYMATRYYGEDGNWPGSEMTNGAEPKPWALTMLWDWHRQDPVSQKEIDRNNAVYQIQNNRNPFIDHPEYVGLIWFNTGVGFDHFVGRSDFNVFPNPIKDWVFINMTDELAQESISISISDEAGRQIYSSETTPEKQLKINTTGFSQGFYFLTISAGKDNPAVVFKLVK